MDKTKASNEKMEREKPPVLVIGCGGTGLRILRLLRTKYLEEILELSGDMSINKLPEELMEKLPIELFGIDTLVNQEGLDLPSLQQDEWISLGPIQLDRFLQNYYKNDRFIQTWFNPNQYAGLMSTGAMQIRAFGRLALFLKLTSVVAKLNRKIQNVIDASHVIPEEIEDSTFKTESGASVQVHIVGNIGGGTGSGIMLDIAYLLRYISNCPLTINAHLIMPEAVPDIQIQSSLYANAYAFLKELDNFNLKPDLYRDSSPIWRYLNTKDKKEEAPVDSDDFKGYEPRVPPFDYTYLLSPFTLSSSCLNKDFFEEIISEKIFLCSMNEIGDREYERVCNIRAQFLDAFYADNEITGKPRSYSSYGVSTLRVRTETIKNKMRKHVLKKISSIFYQKKKEDLSISVDEGFVQELLKSATLDKLVVPDLSTSEGFDVKQEQLKKWFTELTGKIDKAVAKGYEKIKEYALREFKNKHGIITIKIKGRPAMPVPRIKDETDISGLSGSSEGKKVLTVKKDLQQNMLQNLKLNLYGRIEEQFRLVSERCNKIGIWTNKLIKQSQTQSGRGDKAFDNILFYNFDVKSITGYIREPESAIDKMDIVNLFNAYDSDDNNQQKLQGLINGIVMDVWNEFAAAYKKEGNKSPEKRLTVSNFLSIIFGHDRQKLENILASFKEIADPCWGYNDYFCSYVKTIALIGCKEDNYLAKELKGWSFFGADLEATGLEEDPFEIPLVISQHGLPLLGYKSLSEYKAAYLTMRQKFKSTRFKRQFHLDKRWEDEKTDPLIDPFQDLPDSYLPHFNGQLFAFAWYLQFIRENNYIFSLELPDAKQEEKLNNDDKSAGVTEALNRFCELLLSMKIEENGKEISLEQKIKKEMRNKLKSTLEKKFKEDFEEFSSKLKHLQKGTKKEEDRATIGRLLKYIDFFVENDFSFLPELKDKMQNLIASLQQ